MTDEKTTMKALDNLIHDFKNMPSGPRKQELGQWLRNLKKEIDRDILIGKAILAKATNKPTKGLS